MQSPVNVEKIFQAVTEDFLKTRKSATEILTILLMPLFKSPTREGLDSC